MSRTKDKPYNNGQWTEARFHSFIKGGLRALSNKWGPKFEILKQSRVERGIYKCAGYERKAHKVPVSIVVNGKRVRNISVDHILPVIDPSCGFTTWDDVIERMFVEIDGLQLLCKECHDAKTKQEKQERKAQA